MKSECKNSLYAHCITPGQTFLFPHLKIEVAVEWS